MQVCVLSSGPSGVSTLTSLFRPQQWDGGWCRSLFVDLFHSLFLDPLWINSAVLPATILTHLRPSYQSFGWNYTFYSLFRQFCYFIWSSVGLNALLHSSSNASQGILFFKYSPPTLLPVKKRKKEEKKITVRSISGTVSCMCVYVIFFFTLWKSFTHVVQAIFTAVYGDRCGFNTKNQLPRTP